MRLGLKCVLALGVFFLSAATAAQSKGTPTYHLTVFDAPGVSGFIGTQALGINPHGDIVGVYVTNGLNTHGFLLRKGKFTTIDAPGASFPPPPTSGGTGASGINPQGDIVGSYNDSSGNIHGFLLRKGTFTVIDAPGSNFTGPSAINPRGDIVGLYFDSSPGAHGFLLSKSKFSTIDVPGAVYTDASGINPQGDIVGFFIESSGLGHGFLLSHGAFTTIDVPGGIPGSTQALGINPQGSIVGTYADSNDFFSNWLLSKGTFTAPITQALNPETCSCNIQPFSINPRGKIVGAYFDSLGIHGFLLSK
jgi:uncharacterized membrane protein